jgi:hypothetical protein
MACKFFESDLFTLSEATMCQQQAAILFEKRQEDLEEISPMPDPPSGKAVKEIKSPPVVSGAEIMAKALEEAERLRQIRINS